MSANWLLWSTRGVLFVSSSRMNQTQRDVWLGGIGLTSVAFVFTSDNTEKPVATLLFPFVLGVWSISTSAADWHRCSTKLGHPSNLFIWFLWGIWHYISGRIFPIYRLNSINQLLRCYYLKKKGNCDDMSNNCRLQFRKWQLTNQCGRQWLLFGNVIDRWRPFYGICLEFSRPINVVSS